MTEAHHYTVLAKFGGTYDSASSDEERREFQKMLTFVKKYRPQLDAVIVYHTSRFSRTGSTTVIEELEKMSFIQSLSNIEKKINPKDLT